MKMYDKIVNLIVVSLRTGKIDPKSQNLLPQKKFISKVEKDFKTTGLKPKHVTVELSDGSVATVSLCDIEYMIISLLTDNLLM